MYVGDNPNPQDDLIDNAPLKESKIYPETNIN